METCKRFRHWGTFVQPLIEYKTTIFTLFKEILSLKEPEIINKKQASRWRPVTFLSLGNFRSAADNTKLQSLGRL